MATSPTTFVFPDPSPEGRHAVTQASVVRHSRSLSGRSLLNSFVICLVDALALMTALVSGDLIRILVLGETYLSASVFCLIPAWWIGAAVSGLLPGWGLSAVDHLRRQVVLITTLFCFGAVLMFFTKTTADISRLSIGATWMLTLVLIPFGRTLARRLLSQQGLYGLPTIIFGGGNVVAEIIHRLRADAGLGYIPVGICTDDSVTMVEGVPVVGPLDTRDPHGSAAVVASRGLEADMNRAVISRALLSYRNVMVVPDMGDVPSLLVSPRDLSGSVGLQISQTILSPYATKFKRAFDLTAVVLFSPVWVPICAVLCIAIWLEDRRPPVFKQARVGRNNVTFYAYKCRTMVPCAEEVLKRHLDENPALRREWEESFKLKTDPRITRVGNFLRKTSLDELPQLVNVLKGEMALVGPRPLPQYHLDQLGWALRSLRSHMRPGLTGLWQVSGRSDIGNEGMRRWDHYYVRNWSMWLDIVILVRTFRVVVMGSGAR